MGMIILGILIPFAGTTIGAASVYFMRNGIRDHVGLCLRYYGGSFRVVSSDSGHEDFRESGASCFFAGCGRILLRDPVFDVS